MSDPPDRQTRKMPAAIPPDPQVTQVMPFVRPTPPRQAAPVVVRATPDVVRQLGEAGRESGQVAAAPVKSAPAGRQGLVASTLVVMAATVVSRVLGIARESVIAARFGLADGYGAYVAAFRIPDTLYLLIIGGALGSALIPIFSSFTARGEMAKAWRLANAVITYALTILLVAALFAFVFATQLTAWFIAPAFTAPEQEQVTNLTRILLLSPILLGLGGIAMALLNSQHRFVMPAIAPLIYNVCIIGGALVLGDRIGVYGLAVGVVVGAALYLAIQLPELIRLGLRFRPRFDRTTAGLGEVARLVGPRLVGQAAFQLNFIVITAIASGFGEAAVGAFNYAYIMLMLPHGIFALSVATVTFPTLSALYGAGKLTDFRATFDRALRQIAFFALPSAVGLGVLARPLARSLYQFGKFDAASTDLVGSTLVYFALALVPFGVTEIVTRAFYALHDTRTPVIAAVATIALNVTFSLLLRGPMGYLGLAASLALTNWLEMILLCFWLYRRLAAVPSAPGLAAALVKMLVASGAMGAVLLLLMRVFGPQLASPAIGKLEVISATVLMVAAGGIVYAESAYILRLPELRAVIARVAGRLKR